MADLSSNATAPWREPELCEYRTPTRHRHQDSLPRKADPSMQQWRHVSALERPPNLDDGLGVAE
jgi:hypothetical protein